MDYINLTSYTIAARNIAFIDWDERSEGTLCACIYFLQAHGDDVFNSTLLIEKDSEDYQKLAKFFTRS